jgi:hypothetical protein
MAKNGPSAGNAAAGLLRDLYVRCRMLADFVAKVGDDDEGSERGF